MQMRKFAGTAALVIAATGVTAGTTYAAPAADANAPINYTATTTDTNAIVRTDAGSLVVENGNFEIKAANGNVVAGVPLQLKVDDFTFPVAADISGNTATLTPQVDVEHAKYTPLAKDVALPYEDQAPWKSDYDREQAAWGRLRDTIGAGATIGTLVGGIGGAAVGCVLGGIVGAGAAAAAIVGLFGPLVPAGILGCLGGMAAIGFLGTLAGQLLVTAPVAIAAAIQYFSTINEPHIQSK
ncbi:hypothetical protein D7D52_28835 [Nocardia yunnanensis]|uniref:DUF8020 domain-containing protein n=1 Tax=Nocardia yunnanensis TaxID=2382165 RepID=A0A386ZKJ8_9NOCA|nr:hypothetical protein [Nocardia yunnanensis]AYF77159.1 hypothetical protein D7D52_28835 [Nocardia yunnanensis]